MKGASGASTTATGPPRQVNATCNEEVKAHLPYGRPSTVTVDIILLDGTALRLMSEIQVRDVLIAGMGDSIAAGEGNPDRAVRLSDEGFCFKRFEGGEYYRPGRAGFSGNRSCNTTAGDDAGISDWARQSARWMSGPCHRSLYSYQMRTALALAVESPAPRGHVSSPRMLGRDHQDRVFSRASAHASARTPVPAQPVRERRVPRSAN